jgi:hypothetical protein
MDRELSPRPVVEPKSSGTNPNADEKRVDEPKIGERHPRTAESKTGAGKSLPTPLSALKAKKREIASSIPVINHAASAIAAPSSLSTDTSPPHGKMNGDSTQFNGDSMVSGDILIQTEMSGNSATEVTISQTSNTTNGDNVNIHTEVTTDTPMASTTIQFDTPAHQTIGAIESPQTPPPTRPHLDHHLSLDGRTDIISHFMREEYRKIADLTDDEVYEACIKAGIVNPMQTHGNVHFTQKVEHIAGEKLRDQLADFNTFTQYLKQPNKKTLHLGDGIVKSDLVELWVGEEKVEMKRKRTTGLGTPDDGVYKWVYWRDGAGVVRTSVAKGGNAVVKTFRAMRWPKKYQRWRVFSFNGRDAHTPWERHNYANRLQKSSPSLSSTNSTFATLEKPGAKENSITPSTTKIVETKTFYGTEENFTCTLLRVETIEALRLYCEGDYYGFMDMIHAHKSLITMDIRHNLNRGPIFSGAMVGYALNILVQASLRQFIPQETLACVRDIMYHYLANRNLKARSHFGILKWRADAFDTAHFNARNHFSDEFSDGFFSECQEVIRCGYGDTQEERCKSGAAVSAILYTASLAAMDAADSDNALYAQNLVSAVGVIANAANSLIMAAPVPGASMITSNLLGPLSAEIKQKIQNRYTKGALRGCVVKSFRETYVLGALRGERISGMRHRHENEYERMVGDERTKFLDMLKKRRGMGRKYIDVARMYVSALGEEWPSIAAIDEETYASLTKITVAVSHK